MTVDKLNELEKRIEAIEHFFKHLDSQGYKIMVVPVAKPINWYKIRKMLRI